MFCLGGACRLRVVSKYKKQFRCPIEAGEYYYGTTAESDSPMVVDTTQQPTKCDVSTQTEQSELPVTTGLELHPRKSAVELLGTLHDEEQLRFVAEFICKFAYVHNGVNIDTDFIQHSLSASRHLKQCNQTNVVYGIARAIGKMRPDGSNSRLPAK